MTTSEFSSEQKVPVHSGKNPAWEKTFKIDVAKSVPFDFSSNKGFGSTVFSAGKGHARDIECIFEQFVKYFYQVFA